MTDERRRILFGRTARLIAAVSATCGLMSTGCADDPAHPRGSRSDRTTTQPSTTMTTSASTTTTTTASTAGTTIAPASPPIPTDPASLGSCDDIPANVSASVPARRWPTDVRGWQVRYAYSSGPDGAATASAPTRSDSVLARAPAGGRVDAMVAIGSTKIADTPGLGTSLPSTGTVRGHPGSIGPEVTRGGPTGGLAAEWVEDGNLLNARSHGLESSDLAKLLDALTLDDGIATRVPAGWIVIGSSRSTGNGLPHGTVIGLTRTGDPLEETGYAPVELVVTEPAGNGQRLTGPQPPALAVERLRVDLRTSRGRLAVVSESSDGYRTVDTTDRDGYPVHVASQAPIDDLLRLAAGIGAIGIDDPRLVGVAMAAVQSSPGAWCREDR